MRVDASRPDPGHLDQKVNLCMSCDFCRSTPINPCPVCSVAPVQTTIRKVKARIAPKQAPRVATIQATPVVTLTTATVGLDTYRHEIGACYTKPYGHHTSPRFCGDPRCALYGPNRQEAAEAAYSKVPWGEAADQCAKAWSEKRYNVATALLIGLAEPELRAIRIACLELVDRNAATRGYLSDRDDTLRKEIGLQAVEECKDLIGFDPRFPRPVSTPERKAYAFAAPVTEPVRMLQAQAPAPSPMLAGDWADLDRRVKVGEITQSQAEEIGTIWRKYTAQA